MAFQDLELVGSNPITSAMADNKEEAAFRWFREPGQNTAIRTIVLYHNWECERVMTASTKAFNSMRASLSAPSAPTSDFVGRIKLDNVRDLKLYNVRSAHCRFWILDNTENTENWIMSKTWISTMSEARTASSWDARAGRKLQSVGAEAFGTHQVEDWPVVCFNPEWCFTPNYSLQFQKFLPCSLLYILAAH